MERRVIAVVFWSALALCALVTKPHPLSWNDLSRLATVDSLVARHTFAIDGSPFGGKTEDKYRYRGRTYSDKSPALALQGAVVATALAPFGVTLTRTPDRAIYLVTLFSVGVWFALGCAYAYAFQRLLGFERRGALLVAALTGLGTLALPYATILSNHVPSGAAALAALYHLAHLARARERVAHAVLGALFLTLAYAFDASAVVFALCAAVLLWRTPLRTWGPFVLACVPVIALQLAYNAAVSSGIGPPAMNQSSWNDPASPFHRADQSLFLLTSPADYARYALYLLVGDKGLISYTPLVLVCAFGIVRMWQRESTRRLAFAIAATFGIYYVLMVAFTNDYGALNYGERRYVNVAFVLCVALGPALAALPGLGAAAVAARLAAALSIAAAMLGVVAPFGEPRNLTGYVFAVEEFGRLAHHAPVQAAIDVVALGVTILLVLRSWSTAAVPRCGTGHPAA